MLAFPSNIYILLLLFLYATSFHISMSSNHRMVHCNEKDQGALLLFKQGIIDPFNKLSTWSSEHDCCEWKGVQCDNTTGRITSLQLNPEMYDESIFKGEINLSLLLQLEFMNYLDLSFNNFTTVSIQPIHNNITISTKLYHLDLSYNDHLHIDNLHWISQLPSLKYLDLSVVNLEKQTNWLQMVATLPTLSELFLRYCELTNIHSSLEYVNLTSLVTLDLSENNFNSELPQWLSLPNLKTLNLRRSQLRGSIPNLLGNLSSLMDLDIGSNFLTGNLPEIQPIHNNITISTKLYHLDLSNNYHLHIDNLHWISQLPSLEYLDLSGVNLEKQTNWLQMVATLPTLSELFLSSCELTNIHSSLKYVNLTSLVTLDLSDNNFNSEISQWLSLPNLETLRLRGNQLRGSIPNWLGNLSSLMELDIGSNFLTGNLPESIGQLSNLYSLYAGNNSLTLALSEIHFSNISKLATLDLSGSVFEFHLDTNWIPSFQLGDIDLSNSVLGPKLPAWLYTQSSLGTLDISSTGISSIDEDKFQSFVAGIEYLYLSNNSISADISNVMLSASVICLDHNNFTGKLPRISAKADVFDVSHNSFSGGFPNSWVNWTELFYIDMESNKLSGELPLDMSNLTELKFINLENNEFSGKIPRMPPNSEMLLLRSNQFEGNIPPQLCNLSALHILELSHNKLSGSIPQCLHKIANMISGENDSSYYSFRELTFNLVMKGQGLKYRYIGLLRTIDLSVNNLSGEIPEKLFRLVKVESLNLSHNHLTGTIPNMIGDMKNLESLDLSYNQFVGEIPQTMSGLTFLEVLNLSYNNFNGQVPQGSQLQTFDAWSYVGNPELCGPPLTKNCTREENLHKTKQHAGGNSFRESLYLGMGVGFAVGLWGLCGSLFLNRTWRHTYFQFLNHVVDKIYVIVAIKFRNFGG